MYAMPAATALPRADAEIAHKIVAEPRRRRSLTVPTFLTDRRRLLEKSPDNLCQSAAEVADVLRRHLAAINQTPTDKLAYLQQRGKSTYAAGSEFANGGRDDCCARGAAAVACSWLSVRATINLPGIGSSPPPAAIAEASS
jgi:hypothetical protein